MSWSQGIQSALHYYLSCAPCFHRAHRRNLRNQAKRDRQERRAYELQHPNHIRQPSPFCTNPNWSEEIALGPGPPNKTKKGKRARNESQRTLTSAGTSSTLVLDPNGSRESNGQGNQPGPSERPASSAHSGTRWNIRRYQREDEDLWGTSMPIIDPRTGRVRQGSNAGTSVGIPGVARNNNPHTFSEGYYYARNPPLNEMHPPIVSSPMIHKHYNTWLKQPPPPARVMEGKEPASGSRSRSGSGTSSRKGDDCSLGQQISARTIEEKYRRGEVPETPTPSSKQSSNGGLRGQRHDRDLASKLKAVTSEDSRRRQRLDAVGVSEGSIDTVIKKQHFSEESSSPSTADSAISGVSPQTTRNRRATDRSEADTPSWHDSSAAGEITEPSIVYRDSAARKYDRSMSDESMPQLLQRRSPIVIKDDSLKILQELVSPNALLNSRFIRSPPVEARIRLPAADDDEETQLQIPDVNTRFPGGDVKWRFSGEENEVPQWRDPKMRWSFDL